MAACFAWASVSNWFLKCPSTSSVKPVAGGTSARGAGLNTGLVVVAAGDGGTAVGAGIIGAATAGAGFGGKVRALRGAVAVGISAAHDAALLLLFTIAAGFATLPFADAGFAGVLGGILVGTFADAFAWADGRAVFAALRAGALVLAVFMTSLRLTEFSGEGNPPVEAGRIRHRTLVDDFFDRLTG